MLLHIILRRWVEPLRYAAALAIVAAGCNSCPPAHPSCNCKDIPPGAIPQPCGTYVCRWQTANTAAAARDLAVIYHYEWSADPARLTPEGRRHLETLAQRWCSLQGPVIVETSDDRNLDYARREAVLAALGEMNVQLVADRVVIGRSDAEGLYGQEAPGIAAHIVGSQNGTGANGASQNAVSGGQGGATGAVGSSGFGGTTSGSGMGLY